MTTEAREALNGVIGTTSSGITQIFQNLDDASEATIKSGIAKYIQWYDIWVLGQKAVTEITTANLARDMAIQCVEATTLNMCKSRFTSAYSAIIAL